jgi:AraC family transcriptional regulator, positive regulator of tynA and feaB
MTAKGTSGIQKWSTSVATPGKRLDYWIGAVCEGFLEMDITSSRASHFEASLERGQLGSIGVNRVLGTSQDVYRTRSAISRSQSNYYYLLCKTDSEFSVVHHDNVSRILPGDLTLVDSRRRYEFHFPVSANTISLELPTSWVETWVREPNKHIGKRIDGHAGWGRALSGFSRQMSPEVTIERPLPPQVLVDQLGALLALSLGQEDCDSDSGRHRDTLCERIHDVVRQRYSEPGLTAATVATHLHISERTLHRCLNNAGMTFGGILNRCRMATAHRMLTDARFDRLSIGGVGLRIGLSDPSHFIRQCRKHLGMTPGELRRKRGS